MAGITLETKEEQVQVPPRFLRVVDCLRRLLPPDDCRIIDDPQLHRVLSAAAGPVRLEPGIALRRLCPVPGRERHSGTPARLAHRQVWPQDYGQGRYGAFWRRVHNVQLYRFRPGLLPNLPANGSGFQHRRVLDGGDDGGELVREAARCGYGHCHERLRDWRSAGARCGVVSHHPRLETDRLYLRGFHYHDRVSHSPAVSPEAGAVRVSARWRYQSLVPAQAETIRGSPRNATQRP